MSAPGKPYRARGPALLCKQFGSLYPDAPGNVPIASLTTNNYRRSDETIHAGRSSRRRVNQRPARRDGEASEAVPDATAARPRPLPASTDRIAIRRLT